MAARRALCHVCESQPSVARKLLMARKIRLNITKAEEHTKFCKRVLRRQKGGLKPYSEHFRCACGGTRLGRRIRAKPVPGTTGRFFPTVMKASPLLRAGLQLFGQWCRAEKTRCGYRMDEGARPVFDYSLDRGCTIYRPDVMCWPWAGKVWHGWVPLAHGPYPPCVTRC